MPILTTAGVLQGGLISTAARKKFVDDTILLLYNGNESSTVFPSSLKFAGSSFLGSSFDIDSITEHESTFPVWHKVFIDVMFQATANALDIDGSTPLSPILDYTVVFANFGFQLKNLTIPEFAIGMAIPDPTFQAQLQYFFDVDVLDITPQLLIDIAAVIPFPTLPQIPLPIIGLTLPDLSFEIPIDLPAIPLPDFIIPPIPPIQFPDILPLPAIGFIACAVVQAIPKIFGLLIAKALSGDLIKALAEGPAGLIVFTSSIVVDAITSCLGIELKNVLTFLTGFIVYIERLIAMLIVVVIGCIFGEGQLVIIIAKSLGLT